MECHPLKVITGSIPSPCPSRYPSPCSHKTSPVCSNAAGHVLRGGRYSGTWPALSTALAWVTPRLQVSLGSCKPCRSEQLCWGLTRPRSHNPCDNDAVIPGSAV